MTYVGGRAIKRLGLFAVGDEVAELGSVDMFADMFDALERGVPPIETFIVKDEAGGELGDVVADALPR